ncbi:unnamed protein product [Spirodela intermedia]|uniref:VQ domain-containing protein n=1 Tax=Spirodela intermedia TaxID=51605 RepID=A0A7I8ISZ9_SPIIN|nr:unnamed protein product [Spirodela intermedia]CAA6661133.1 unnamed protein product [Spirodela intermedia]
MGNPCRSQERESPSTQSSPRTSTSSAGHSNGAAAAAAPPPPVAQKLIPPSDANPYPTTFVQADTSSFKQVVQMLTGSSDMSGKPSLPSCRNGPKRPAFKLCERRHNSFKNLRINPSFPPISPRGSRSSRRRRRRRFSPQRAGFPILDAQPRHAADPRPLLSPPRSQFRRRDLARGEGRPPTAAAVAAVEKGFYLLPSPRSATTPREADPPQLLPLFPVFSSASP